MSELLFPQPYPVQQAAANSSLAVQSPAFHFSPPFHSFQRSSSSSRSVLVHPRPGPARPSLFLCILLAPAPDRSAQQAAANSSLAVQTPAFHFSPLFHSLQRSSSSSRSVLVHPRPGPARPSLFLCILLAPAPGQDRPSSSSSSSSSSTICSTICCSPPASSEPPPPATVSLQQASSSSDFSGPSVQRSAPLATSAVQASSKAPAPAPDRSAPRSAALLQRPASLLLQRQRASSKPPPLATSAVQRSASLHNLLLSSDFGGPASLLFQRSNLPRSLLSTICCSPGSSKWSSCSNSSRPAVQRALCFLLVVC